MRSVWIFICLLNVCPDYILISSLPHGDFNNIFQFVLWWRFVLGTRGLQFPFTSDWLGFVPRTSSRPSPGALCCLAPRFPCLPTDFLLFRTLVPGLRRAALFCFAPRLPLSSIDVLLFHAVVPGLLPPALFCSAQRFLLYSRPHPFVFQAYFLCVVCHFVSFCRSHSFVSIARCPLLPTFAKQ